MSILKYNDIVLPYSYCTSFRQEPVYDDMGSTDWYCTRFEIGVQAVIHPNYIPVMASDLLGANAKSVTNNPAQIMKVIRSRLLRPRRELSFTFNGIEMIPASTGGIGTVDVQNGPKPQSCVITQLNNGAYLIVYHIIAHYWENNTIKKDEDGNPIANGDVVANHAGNNVLLNRWTDTMELDITGLTRRIREGKFIIRSDNAEGKIAARCIPQMAVVGIPAQFIRESSQYQVSPDGLAIQYRVVDREQFKMPPEPAYEADGEYTESTDRGNARRFGAVRVTLRGAKTTPQSQLIEVAVAVCAAKLGLVGAPVGGAKQANRGILQHASITQRMYKNEVEAVLAAQFPNSRHRLDNVPGVIASIASTPFSDRADNPGRPDMLAFGTAARLIQAAAYYDPSLRNTVLDENTDQLSRGFEVGTAGVGVEP